MNGQLFRLLRAGISNSAPLSGALQGCIKTNGLSSKLLSVNNVSRLPLLSSIVSKQFHVSACANGVQPPEPQKWPKYNEIVYPPRPYGEPMRVAEVFHHRSNIKYSYKKMWYIASMIRGMSIDEAIKQLQFLKRAGGKMVIDVLEEAQEIAVRDHNVEYKSNLWIAESFVGKAHTVKSLRKHRGYRFGKITYGYIHYFVCLREGKPPKDYYTPVTKTGNEHIESYIEKMRNRRISYTL